MYSIAFALEGIVSVLALILLLKKRNYKFLILTIYIIFSTTSDLLSKFAFITLSNGKRSNHYYFNLEFIIEISLLILLFFNWSKIEKIHKSNNYVWFLGIWLTVSIANLISIQGFFILNSYTFLVGYLVSVIVSLSMIFITFNNSVTNSLLKNPEIFIWIGILISASASFTYRVVEPLLNFNNQSLFTTIIVTSAIIKYIFISIGFIIYLNHREKPVLQS